MKGDFTETATIRASSFETSFELPEGYYTVIVHGRVFADDGLTKYDVAKGKKKTIEKPPAEDETLIKKSAIFIGIGASIVTLVSTISLYRKRAKAAQMQQDVANMQKEQTEVLKLLAATANAAMSTGNAVKSEVGHQGRRDTVQLEKDLDALQKEVCIRKDRSKGKVGGGGENFSCVKNSWKHYIDNVENFSCVKNNWKHYIDNVADRGLGLFRIR